MNRIALISMLLSCCSHSKQLEVQIDSGLHGYHKYKNYKIATTKHTCTILQCTYMYLNIYLEYMHVLTLSFNLLKGFFALTSKF